MNTPDQDEVLRFQLQRIFAVLGRNILMTIEDLKVTHDNNFNKLRDNLPVECGPIVNMSDYFDGNQYAWLRKRVLDQVQGSRRDLEQLLKEL